MTPLAIHRLCLAPPAAAPDDGTLSLFATLIESAAPYRTDFHDLSAVARMFNAPGVRAGLGMPADGNVELLVRTA